MGGGTSGIGGITSKVEKPEFSLQGISKNMQVLEGGGGGTLRYLFDPFSVFWGSFKQKPHTLGTFYQF